MSLELIEIRIEKEVGRRADEVLGLLFDKAKKLHVANAHKETCDCAYCRALSSYVSKKMRFSRVRRMIDEDCQNADEYNEKVSCYRGEIKRLRAVKNAAKRF